ncbi:protoporphyrinogen oxidase HemJ [Marinomonas piezotolerans]|uniref:Protoporphyrinogen IX oxidase n=1 Tax=Marinomonas piezotolerans TaxID=2213058 RepID=A0A370U4F1_9GAMM|nr:protoporphyrinogen oxidase HemJ [Marinomonas piezotolerans]RDL42652.1 protoporphyrinogen oxidase HemJ [Marinomonas piezotolerans]
MLWVKAFHIVAMVSWFAALFYLPRLFVYHAAAKDSESIERFKVMERKLYRGIMTPAAIATIVLGVWLVTYAPSYYMQAGWFHAKLLLVVLLLGYHHACGRLLKKFAQDENNRSHVFYRWFNEFPVLVLIGVSILVVVRPF